MRKLDSFAFILDIMKKKIQDENTFVSLGCVNPDLEGLYEINRKGEVRNIRSGRILKIFNTSNKYPAVNLKLTKQKLYTIHTLLAKVFIPNPYPANKKYVDHIDRDKNNYSLDNLRWVTCSENNKNKDPWSSYIFQKLDPSTREVVEELDGASLSNSQRDTIQRSIRQTTKYKGNYWKKYKKIDKDLEEFYSIHGKPETYIWKKPLGMEDNTKILISDRGLIYSPMRGYCFGNKSTGYYSITILGKTFSVHRLIYETFVLGRKLLPGEEIDHIDTNPFNNSVENLRLCNHSENMNNPLTMEKQCRKVKKYSLSGEFIKEYNSLTQAAKESNTADGKISLCCRGKLYISTGGYLWCYSGEEHVIQEKLKKLSKKNEPKTR